jgi:hypothetical protein
LLRRVAAAMASSRENSGFESFTVIVGMFTRYYEFREKQYDNTPRDFPTRSRNICDSRRPPLQEDWQLSWNYEKADRMRAEFF